MNTSNSTRTIILCAGTINYSNLPIGTSQSNAMVPVNGKPVIAWILDDLLKKGINKYITIVLRHEDERLRSFLLRSYASRTRIDLVGVTAGGSILQSLLEGLNVSTCDCSIRLILGDTLIRDSYESDSDFVYVGEVNDPRRWCLVNINDEDFVVSYLNKPDNLPTQAGLALSGYYHFINGEHLCASVDTCISKGATELSQVLELYSTARPIKAITVTEWYDFGSIDNLVAARQQLLQSRYFNSLQIDPLLGTITKRSVGNEQKLGEEIRWYLHLPDELKILCPRVIEFDETPGQVMITQEYYGYPTLAELSLHGNLSASVWLAILARLFEIHGMLCRYPGVCSPNDVRHMYSVKTTQRIAELADQSDHWRDLLSTDTIIIDDKEYQNISTMEQQVHSFADRLALNSRATIIHGDYCFSNILFDLSSQVVRLIDPRGSFGSTGIYGDPRYDIAKLRHSICGFYDHIVADMFDVSGDITNGFRTQIHVDDGFKAAGNLFDELVNEWGYNNLEIRFIEGLLFVSMVPLHRDNPKRQIMMYLTGLRLLNGVYECVSSLT